MPLPRQRLLAVMPVLAAGTLLLSGCGKPAGEPRTPAAAAGQASGAASAAASAPGTAPVSASPSGSSSASPSASASASGTASAPAPGGSKAPGGNAPAGAPAGSSSGGVFTGLAFDTCTAPPASTMNAAPPPPPAAPAPDHAGANHRGRPPPQLTASWVSTVSASGWKLIPLYVGAQPPCQTGSSPEKITAATAQSLGAADGADAAAKAGALGMRAGSTLYLDMEAYNTADTACADAVLTYTKAFDRAVKAKTYRPGFYGFASSSAAGIARAAERGEADLPEALWYAKYDGAADTTGSWPYSAGLFTGHRRGHQYQVNQRETYGGATLTVDRNAWDGPVAVTG
ncbi:glycoside hydrolase domain-containing protein [Streptomyces sp. NPDC059411]|uniref:glycoside hydrolase domain-containing protein n=1 Tax=Streptomyces sp. NPDC059411 TaxID=3346825 RepID=UPI00369D0CE0